MKSVEQQSYIARSNVLDELETLIHCVDKVGFEPVEGLDSQLD
jgi:hypothetical protein